MLTVSKYKAREDQSLFDIALQQTGTIESLFEVAKANQNKVTSLSEPVDVGVLLDVDVTEKNTLVANYYGQRKYKVAIASKRSYELYDADGYPLGDLEQFDLMTKEY
jgi:hypothetical protein